MLGIGTLTPLNKGPAIPGASRDARPIKAEVTDVFGWTKSCHRNAVEHVKALVVPEQLGIGIRVGPEMFVIGIQLHINQEKQGDKNHVGISLDIKNAHNAHDRAKANLTVQEAAQTNPKLKPFAIALDAQTILKPDISMPSNNHEGGFQRLRRSEAGGGQGNALTVVTFALLIERALKEISASYNGILVRAIHDDFLLSGPPEDIFGIHGGKGAL
jgi:hypothetical protein